MTVYLTIEGNKKEFRDIHEMGLSEEQIKLCQKEDLTIEEIGLIADCLASGIPDERIKKYIKHEFSINHCYYIDEDEYTCHYSVIEYIAKGLRLGFSDEQISLYTSKNLNWWRMAMVINGISERFTPEQLDELISYLSSYCISSADAEKMYDKIKNA